MNIEDAFRENDAFRGQLPPEFSGGVIINTIAFSRDLRRYAILNQAGDLSFHDVPSSKVLEFKGLRLTVDEREGVSVEHMALKRSRQAFIDIPREVEVSERFSDIHDLFIQSFSGNIELRTHDRNEIEVSGLASAAPEACAGHLDLGNFGGVVTLPRDGVRAAIQLNRGSLTGEIGCEGSFSTIAGSISLTIVTPTLVEANTAVGRINHSGMLEVDAGLLATPGAKPTGTIRLESVTGDISVRSNLKGL